MKIAMLHTPIVRLGGGIRQILMLARGLKDCGHDPVVFTCELQAENTFTDLLDGLDIRIVNARIPEELRRPEFSCYADLVRMKGIGNAVDDSFDIINPHNFPTQWAAYVAKKRTGAPVVWMCNEPPYYYWSDALKPRGMRYLLEWPLFEIFDRKAVKSAIDRIIVLSNFAGSLVSDAYGADFTVIRSGTDEPLGSIDRFAARKRLAIEDNDFLIIQVGAVVPHKKVDHTLEALAGIRESRIKALFVGEGLLTRYRQKAEDLGIGDRVIFTGPVDDGYLNDCIAASDIFLYPAEQTWGLAAAEAMAAGIPVIASRNNGFSEVITDGENGFTFNAGDINALKHYIIYLYEELAVMRNIGENAKIFVKEHLSWNRYVDRMESAFMDTAGKLKQI